MADSLADRAGRNARQLRLEHGITLETLAAAAKHVGLPWSTGRVSDFENGLVKPDLSTLLLVCAALGAVLRSDVTLAQLLAGAEPVALSEQLTVAGAALVAAVGDQPLIVDTLRPGTYTISVVLEGDQRACRRLGVDTATGQAAMRALWGHPLTVERDRRAGPDASAQRRGGITRTLMDELREEINRGAH
jgi:transcriptional regulator with XRE-family HTH domain